MVPPNPAKSRLIERYIALAGRRPGLLIVLHLLVALLTLPPILGLELHTDLAELLPANHPAVIALREVGPKQISSTNLVMIIEGASAADNHAFIAALRPALDALIGKDISELQLQPETEIPEFAQKWRWLYASVEDLTSAEELLGRVIAQRKSPLIVDLLGDPEAELKALREKLEQKLPARPSTPYFEIEVPADPKKGTTEKRVRTGLMLWRRGGGLAGIGDQELLDHIESIVVATQKTRGVPTVRVEYTGHVPLALAEHDAVRDDLSLATSVCVGMVLLAIFLYFGRISVLAAVGAPAILGLLLALALARGTILYLNANTAFLISIIIGNGINAPIVLIARYGEERRSHSKSVIDALISATNATLRGTFTATAAAALAYGCLLVTSLRGLNQFGLVGCVGMLLVWLVTFTLVPPLVVFGEQLRDGLMTPRTGAWRAPFRILGNAVERSPRLMILFVLALTVAALSPALRYAHDPIEYNLDKLRSDDPAIARRWERMYELGMGNVGAGHIATDGVILVDRPDQADAVAEALLKKDQALGSRSVLREVRTLNKMLPSDQAKKLEILSRIRASIDRNRKLMDASESSEVVRWRPPDELRPLTVPDLPHRVRENFTEVDGTIGRFVGIDADPGRYGEGDGHGLIRLARALEVDALGKHWVAAATSTVFAGMIETIAHDGPTVALAAIVSVSLLVLITLGPSGAVSVLASVLVGITWLVGLLGLFQLKLNFLNFVAVPITLGIGTEYAANLWARLRREPGTPLGEVVANTGSAVALCSLTTIIGYSSLLLGRNRALQSFGKVAALGEVSCLLAALVAIPAIIALLRKRKR